MLLAELVVRHTRRFMPTRRVAIESSYIPTTGTAHGTALLGAVVEEHLAYLDAERLLEFEALLRSAESGVAVPGIALRHRLQFDTHGLDRSRHRIVGEAGRVVVELDVHGAPVPQLLGAVLAAGELPPGARYATLHHMRDVVSGRAGIADDVIVRRLEFGRPSQRPPLPPPRWRPTSAFDDRSASATPTGRRWAADVLGLGEVDLTRRDVNRRFRELLREAHPDHGGTDHDAARRITELTEARGILLTVVDQAAASVQPAEDR